MIVGYFDVIGVAVDEPEAHAPLVVDRYGVLALSGAFEAMQPVAWRLFQVIQACSPMNIFQPAYGPSDYIGGQAF